MYFVKTTNKLFKAGYTATTWTLILLFLSCTGKDAPPVDTPPSAGKEPSNLGYVEMITGNAHADQSLPLVFGIHGLGDRPENFAGLFYDWSFPARVILLRAPKPYHGGFSWFDIKIPYSSNQRSLGVGISEAADLVASFIEQLSNKQKHPKKPAVTGFSQGGMISFAIAVKHPSSVGLSIPLSGALSTTMIPKKLKHPCTFPPIRAHHGDADNMVPISYARATITALKNLGCNVSLQEHQGIGHSIGKSQQNMLTEIENYFQE